MKRFVVRYWPILCIVCLWFIFSYPYFVAGKVPYASTYQGNFFPPWSHYEKFWGPVKNNAMPDVQGQIYPWKKFTIDTYKLGQIPFWNPNSFSGNPHLANVQSAVLSPLNILFFLLPFIDAWSILILLQPLLAGMFMYPFLRSLRASRSGSVIGSIAFMFCGFIVVWMAYGTLAYAILYLPLALFAIEKYWQTRRIIFLLLLAVTIPLSFFSGHFQMSLYFFAALILYVSFKGLTTKQLRTTCYTLFSVFAGFILSLPQLLPAFELYQHAVRSETFLLTEAIPIHYLPTIIAPDFYGNPVTRNDWFGHYAEWASFVGITTFLLALFGAGKTKEKIFFVLLALGSLILSLQSPLAPFIISLKIPVISTSALSRIIVAASFAICVLAALGFDELKSLLEKKKRKKIIAILAIVFLTLLGFLAMAQFFPAIPHDKTSIALKSLRMPIALFFINAAAIIFAVRFVKLRNVIAGILIITTAVHSFYFAAKWMPFDPKDLVYADVPVIESIKEHIGYGRIFGNIGSELTSYFGLPAIEGYDPLYIGRYGEFVQTANNGEFTKGERSLVHLGRRGKYIDRVLDVLGVTLVFHPRPDTDQGWAYPVWQDKERYKVVYEDDKFQLFHNTMALERPSLFYSYEVITDDKELLKRFYTEDFDFRKVLLLEDDPNLTTGKDASGSTKMVQYTPTKIQIDTKTDAPALLFLSDNYYPGWKAKINGKEVKILRANYSFRAVVVPAGEANVEFTYIF